MKLCIHRGSKEIGGTCIELESQGKRIVLDIGQPLDCPDPEEADLPAVKGFREEDESLLGVVISHSHLENGKLIKLGPFTVTPFLVDHSAYDAYAVLVEADGKRVFYTGDLRGHGRKASLFERLVAHPPADVDVLLMEGSTIHRQGTEKGFKSEGDLDFELTEIFKTTPGMPLIWCSGLNIDRIVTVFKAARRSGRQLIIDMYTAHILNAIEKESLPQANWQGIRVYLPYFQKRRIIRLKQFELAKKYSSSRIYPEELAAVKDKSVMLFRDRIRKNGLLRWCSPHILYVGWISERGAHATLPGVVGAAQNPNDQMPHVGSCIGKGSASTPQCFLLSRRCARALR